MYKIRWSIAAVAILAVIAILPNDPGALDLGNQATTVGIDPILWDATIAGANAWVDAGAASFVYVEGCGNGVLNVCVSAAPPDGAGWIAGYRIGEHTIYVYDLNLYDADTACHEVGHALGLWYFADGSIYHRADGDTCMRDGPDKPAHPDAIDLMNLGITPPAATPEPTPAQSNDGTGGPELGNGWPSGMADATAAAIQPEMER